jgi:hypothetical protein
MDSQKELEPVAFINRRLEDLAEANAIYGKDQRLDAQSKVERNNREISWLKDLRSIFAATRDGSRDFDPEDIGADGPGHPDDLIDDGSYTDDPRLAQTIRTPRKNAP